MYEEPAAEINRASSQADRSVYIENRQCQQNLAQKLVACLGQEGAVRACRENAWNGLLHEVQALKRTG